MYLTINKTAEHLQVPSGAIRRLVKTGKAKGFYSGTRFYVHVETLVSMLDSMTNTLNDAKKE